MTDVRLIVNPVARGLPRRERLLLGVEWLRAHGASVDVQLTRSAGHATALAAEAAEGGFDCVAVCGGDGTLNEALNGLLGSTTALATVRGGTANVWAREAGIPRAPEQALRLVLEGARRRLDAGLAGTRAFLLMASAGLDSLVVAGLNTWLKRRFGSFAYIGSAAMGLRAYRGVPALVTLDGERFETSMLAFIAGNTRSYGGMIEIARYARADDGLLDACIYSGSGRRPFLGHLVRTTVGRHIGHGNLLYRRVRDMTLQTEIPFPVQADGELIGSTPLALSVYPAAVTVVVPRGLRSPLWRDPP